MQERRWSETSAFVDLTTATWDSGDFRAWTNNHKLKNNPKDPLNPSRSTSSTKHLSLSFSVCFHLQGACHGRTWWFVVVSRWWGWVGPCCLWIAPWVVYRLPLTFSFWDYVWCLVEGIVRPSSVIGIFRFEKSVCPAVGWGFWFIFS